MKIRKIIITVIFIVVTSMLALFVYDLLTNLGSENLANLTTPSTSGVNNTQNTIREIKNVAIDASSNISTTNHMDLKDPAIIAGFAVCGVLVLLVVCGVGYVIYQYNMLPVPQPENVDTIELQNM
uniref:hypothetical protein n=1 Tax=Inonotus hispidus TaxID=40469 RepID=UPI0021825076|nr:hypothetical protein N4M07_mgp039 [Inonotus hispidus]UVF38013.1 hypothetical protein [Inonotus hispidus]